MSYLTWDRETNMIKYDDGNRVVDFNCELTLLDQLGKSREKILLKIFGVQFQDILLLIFVC